MAASHRRLLQAAASCCLLMLLLLQEGSVVAAAASTTSSRPLEEEDPDIEPEDAAGYRTYIVMLEPPISDDDDLKLDGGDADARRAWHQSFLPSEKTVLGEPRLRWSYDPLFHGFSARLTKDELKELSSKPGFLHAFPNAYWYPQTTHSPAEAPCL